MKLFFQKLTVVLFLISQFFCVTSAFAKSDKDVELLRKSIIKQTLSQSVDNDGIKQIIETIQPDGTWPGINYQDVSRRGFQHTRHLENLINLSIAYSKKGNPWKGNRNVKTTFEKGVKHWLKHDYQSDNWWHNEIGTPKSFITMLLAMDKKLSGDIRQPMLKIASRANLQTFGARPSGDRIFLAGLEAKWALYSYNIEVVEAMMKEIEKELKFSPAGQRGVQADYSFHHRLDRVNNTLSYGLNFINVYTEWALLVKDTRFKFSDQSMKLAIDYYLDGVCKQMPYGRTEDTGILNRDIVRVLPELMSALTPQRMMEISDYRKNELEQIVNARLGKPFEVATYAKFFWQTEYFAVQRPHYFTSVRMYSVRNRNMEEAYNSEGVKNHFRADGTNYLTIKGNEYLNLAPMTDWSSIPGTTTPVLKEMPDVKQIQKEGVTDFVGGVTDGYFGAAAFDFISQHFPLKAKKSWFFFEDEYVCLGTGISASCVNPIVTTINQCYLKGDVNVLENKSISHLTKGTHIIKKAEAVWHDGVGYWFPNQSKISIMNNEASGTQYSVSPRTTSSKEIQRADVFKMRVEHGVRPSNASYAYVVLPNSTVQTLIDYAKHPEIRILSNTSSLQAVEQIEKRILGIVGYKAFSLQLDGKRGTLTADSPGMFVLHFTEQGKLVQLSVADPTRKLGKIHFSIEGRYQLAEQHTNTKADYCEKKNCTFVSVELPQHELAGSSVTLRF